MMVITIRQWLLQDGKRYKMVGKQKTCLTFICFHVIFHPFFI